jgi:hypothetical protein
VSDEQGGADNLSGRWHGFYSYPDPGPPIAFEADLHESAGSLTGTTTELSDYGETHGQILHAVLDGRRDGSSISFLKMYDGVSPDHDVVRYEGTLDAEENEIEGIWVVPGIWSGRFLMVRARGEAVAEEAKVEEKLPLGR